MLGLFLVFSFFDAMYTTLTGVYPPEVLSTEIRGIGTGFATAVSRVGAGIGTFLMPISMHSLGAGLTTLIAVAFAGAGLTQWLAPETNGKSLTEAAGGIMHEPVIHCQEGSAPRYRRSGRRDNAQRPARQRRSSEPLRSVSGFAGHIVGSTAKRSHNVGRPGPKLPAAARPRIRRTRQMTQEALPLQPEELATLNSLAPAVGSRY